MGLQRVGHDQPTEKQQENYSAIKRNEILPFATMWMDLENIIWPLLFERLGVCVHLPLEGFEFMQDPILEPFC